MNWKVYSDGKWNGIVETNYAHALAFWTNLGRRNGCKYRLVKQ